MREYFGLSRIEIFFLKNSLPCGFAVDKDRQETMEMIPTELGNSVGTDSLDSLNFKNLVNLSSGFHEDWGL